MPHSVKAYQAFMERCPVPMILADRKTLRYLAVNQAALKLYGYSREQMLRMTPKDVRPASGIPFLLREVKRVRSGPCSHGVVTHLRQGGSAIEVEVSSQAVSLPGGPAILSTLVDRSERKRIAAELERSRRLLDGVMTNVPAFVIKIDRRLRIEFINRLAKGFRISEVVGSSALDYIDPRDRSRIGRAMRAVLRGGKPVVSEMRGRGDHGQTRYYHTSMQPIVEDGRVAAILLLATDVTERRAAELESESSRAMLDTVLANIPDYVLTLDARGKILYVNKVAEGFSKSKLIGADGIGHADPSDRPKLRKMLGQVLRTGKPARFETSQAGPDGKMLWFRGLFQRMPARSREPTILSVATDVTAVRAAERTLKESRESYRILFEANPNPMVVSDRLTGQYLAVNDAAVALYGYSREEWLKMSIYDIRPPEEARRLKHYRRRIHFGVGPHGVWSHRKKDGSRIDVDVTTSLIRFDGRPASLAMLRDVTFEGRVQQELQRSREHYRALFEGHPLPMWVGDYATLRILDVNQAAVKTFGFSREEFLGKRITQLRPKTEVATLMKSVLAKPRGAVFRGPTVYRRKDGTLFDADVYVTEVEYEGRRAFVTSVLDITDRLKAKQAEQRFASLFNASRDGMNFIDLQGRIRDVNQALCRMLGYERRELLGKHTIGSLTPPEYHAMNRAAFKRLLSTGEAIEYEKEYIRKDGSRVPVSLTAFVLPGSDGRPAGFAGIVRDISERKRLEKEILEVGAREQSSIGRELHDSLGQHLTGVSFLAKSLKAQLSRTGSSQARLAERIAQTASDAVEQVRALAAGLVPAELLPDGLPAALSAMAVQAEKTFGIECSVRCPERLVGLEEFSLLHLYRIAQEAVSNAAKHSGADRVQISLRELKGRMVLEIADNGRGITRRRGTGLGLKIMAHRAQALGGTFDIKQGRHGGTVVTCSCPYRRPLL